MDFTDTYVPRLRYIDLL